MQDFDAELQQVIEERESILFEIERAIFTRRYNLSVKHQSIFATQSISMIYSLWESFIQKSFNLYIDEINRLIVDFYALQDGIIIHHMENSFKQFKEYPENNDKKSKFFTSLQRFYRTDANPIIIRLVNTESNVGFSVLNKLLRTFALEEFPENWQIYKPPHPNLKGSLNLFLRLRNSVAHGGDLVLEDAIDKERYVRFKNLIIDLMYEIRLKMLYGLEHRTFLK